MIKRPLTRRTSEPEDEGWLITFADMAVLLMSFFILMFALSAPESQKIMNNVTASLRERGFYSNTIPSLDPTDEIKDQLVLALVEKGYDRYVAASVNEHGVDVELASSAFFEPGAARFSEAALPMLQTIVQQITPIAREDVSIEVVGHTDDTPIATAQFPSNWELSTARASNVVRYLIAQRLPAQKLRAVGLADTQPKAANRDEQGNPLPANQNLNRRIVIKIIRGDDN